MAQSATFSRTDSHHQRASHRLFNDEDGQWYFRSRESTIEGPFPSRLIAHRMLERHIRECRFRRGWLPRWPRPWSPLRLLRRPPSKAPARTG